MLFLLGNRIDAPKPLRNFNGELANLMTRLETGDLSEEEKFRAEKAFTAR
jgi:hypothetical protein